MSNSVVYDGKPSIELNHRPFFSIVIACYNAKKYLSTVLQSIVDQHMNDDIEVILSDDHSTEDYTEVVDLFKNTLCIKRVQTDYNFAPGNTRERGAQYATGEWLAFADQDDKYVADTLPYIKQEILKNNEKYYVVSSFLEVNINTDEVIRAFKFPLGWNHAKFYNLDNTWKAYDIHFKKDLRSHEDIYISSTMNSFMNFMNRQPLYLDIYTYIWYCNPESITHTVYDVKSGGHTFLEVFFNDYLRSTGYVYIEQYLKGKISKEYAIRQAINITAYAYFYNQGFLFHNPKNFLRENIEYARGYLVIIKRLYGLTNEDIWNGLAANDAEEFTSVENSAHVGAGPFIPLMTLMEFLNLLHKDGDQYPIENVRYCVDTCTTSGWSVDDGAGRVQVSGTTATISKNN